MNDELPNHLANPAVNSEAGEKELPPVQLILRSALRVNFSSAQNDVPVIKQLTLINSGEEDLSDIEISVEAVPPVIRPKTWNFDRIAAGTEVSPHDMTTQLDVERLGGLNETEIGILKVRVSDAAGVLLEETRRLELLARDEWGGLGDMDRLLAAYVSPNDPVIAGLLKQASMLLERAGHDGSMEGYQSGNPQRAWMIAGAIWSAATGMGLTYANPPASFELQGQKVRSPARIRDEGLVTCLDSALLLAAAWEQAGLNPVILFREGHAWAGVWIAKRDFGSVSEPDVVAVRKAVQAREFVAVETTLLARRPTVGFEVAVEKGRAQLAEEREHEFRVAVDFARARAARIRPLASHVAREGAPIEQVEAAPAKLPDPIELGLFPTELHNETPDTPKGRIERWQAKLLDLSLRNRLLNFKATGQTVPCMVPDVGALEDALAADKAFQAYSLMDDDPIGERQLLQSEKAAIIASAVADAFARSQITVPLEGADTEKRLLALFRKAKSDIQEGGTNTLFLATGCPTSVAKSPAGTAGPAPDTASWIGSVTRLATPSCTTNSASP